MAHVARNESMSLFWIAVRATVLAAVAFHKAIIALRTWMPFAVAIWISAAEGVSRLAHGL